MTRFERMEAACRERREASHGVLLTDEGRDRRIKCVRRWLRHVRTCVTMMRVCEEELAAERDRLDMLKGMAYDGDSRGSGLLNGDDRIVEHIAHIDEIADRMIGYSTEYRDAVIGAKEVFSRLTCHDLAGAVLEEHYLQRRTWERVGRDIGYSESRVKHVADDAMVECYELMPHEWREKIPRADW